MSRRDTIGQEGSVEGANERFDDGRADGPETPELRPSVEQEIQARVDYANEQALDGRLFGQTLVAEERMRAREWEIERTRVRWDRRQESNREARCREAVERVSIERRIEFGRRAASVDPWADPERTDAREQLSRATLGRVNAESRRLAATLDGWSAAAVSRLVARRVVDGRDVTDAVLDVFEELRTAPGSVIPIGLLSEVHRSDVDVEGTIIQLWEPSTANVRQVGLIEDDSGRVKFTSWVKSRQPIVNEGDHVRIRAAKKNWYKGRCSIALIYNSQVIFMGRDSL